MAPAARSTERWQRLWSLFHSALERGPSERGAFLERGCGSDAELRREIEELLAAHEQASGVLGQPAGRAIEPARGSAEPSRDPTQADPNTFPPGELLAGRFEVVRLLGRGGMGTVYEALDLELGTSVALKTLHPEIARDPSAQERFRREINLARQVTHANACRIFDLFHHDDEVFLTMELLGGVTLAERLERAGPIEPSEALPMVEQVVAALAAAHRVGVIHRDLKTSNVMLVPEGEGVRAVVTDFGLAITLRSGDPSAPQLTATGQVLGTPAFMAPEQLYGGEITPATDIYALGLMMYQMLTGELPFPGGSFSAAAQRLHQAAPSPRTYRPGLDRDWERTILRCLEREPADRFQSLDEVLASLKGAGVPGRFFVGRRVRSGVAAAATLLLAAGAVLLWSQSGPAPQHSAALAFQERDWVLISAFENRTGDPLFDGSLERALERELGNSRFVNVVPRQRVGDALGLMKRPLDTRVDAALGREICLRDGGIRALLTGRVEKLGAAFVLSAALVDPAQGATVVSLSEEAQGQEELLAAVRRLSNRVRETLGEELSLIRLGEERLAKVTTPSLRALQLYTRADAVIGRGNDPAAEELLKQAVGEDPEFGSGYMHLAHAIRNQGRPPADYMPYAERALELSEKVPERERYFIRGSYFAFARELEKALANYEALLQLHPDHFWANNNVAHAFEGMGRFVEASSYVARTAELRPNDFGLQFGAALRLAIWADRPSAAEPYIQRAAELASAERWSYPTAWLRLYPAHQHWLRDDPASAERELDRWAATLEARRGLDRASFAALLGFGYSGLGQARKAREMFRLLGESVYAFTRAVEALSLDDRAGMREHLQRSLAAGTVPLSWMPGRTILLTRAGLLSEARESLSELEVGLAGGPLPGWGPTPENKLEILRGELALAEGRAAQAIALLEAALPREQPFGATSYFLGSEALAAAWQQQGNAERALRVLEEASQQRNRTYPASGSAWMGVQLRRVRLYRELGREAEAAEIESGLRKGLARADPDFWALRRLDALRELTAGASPG